ncbi:TPA: hypothetical protein ENG04_02685, partial [Candidatus Poribacteria bacterium]|nr:hypothetical protein [Candidatus Poribacteria bacterium]HEX28971.1 hypothetical protein [Candidatus Poribacteria bacterium]
MGGSPKKIPSVVGRGDHIDLEFILNRFEYHSSKTFFGGESLPQIWLNLGPGGLATYLTGHWKFTTETASLKHAFQQDVQLGHGSGS